LVAVLAIAVGFLAALLIFGGDDNSGSNSAATTTTAAAANGTTTTTATTSTAPATGQPPATNTTPTSPKATTASCIDLWNQPTNRGPQVFLVNVASQHPVRVHVGTTADVPPECLVTIVSDDGSAYVYAEGGGTTYPYAPSPGTPKSADLPAAQKISNALEQPDGRVTAK
jgi:hypothetical protein